MCAMNLIYIGEESVRLCTIIRFARILANHLSNYVLGVAGKKQKKEKKNGRQQSTTIAAPLCLMGAMPSLSELKKRSFSPK